MLHIRFTEKERLTKCESLTSFSRKFTSAGKNSFQRLYTNCPQCPFSITSYWSHIFVFNRFSLFILNKTKCFRHIYTLCSRVNLRGNRYVK